MHKHFGFLSFFQPYPQKYEDIAKVKIVDPSKEQAKEWDKEEEFDHILPLHQIATRYCTDLKLVI